MVYCKKLAQRNKVQLTSGNTEISLMGRHMVDSVVFPWQYDMPVLQKDDPARQTKVGVRPFVNLVS